MFTVEEVKKSLLNLIKYSDPDKDKNTVFIWPEGVFTGYSYEELLQYKKFFKENFSTKPSNHFGINKKVKNDKENYNSLLAVNNNFEIIYQYNKKKLVPFGEFLPAEKF